MRFAQTYLWWLGLFGLLFELMWLVINPTSPSSILNNKEKVKVKVECWSNFSPDFTTTTQMIIGEKISNNWRSAFVTWIWASLDTTWRFWCNFDESYSLKGYDLSTSINSIKIMIRNSKFTFEVFELSSQVLVLSCCLSVRPGSKDLQKRPIYIHHHCLYQTQQT